MFSPASMIHSHYETTNVYLASFLLCSGTVLDGFERLGKRRVQYRFVTDANLHGLLRLYWSNMPVPLVPIALFGSLARLKSLARRQPGTVGGSSDVQSRGASSPDEVSDGATSSMQDSPPSPCPA